MEVKDTGSVQRPLIIEFSATCWHNQYGNQTRSALETKGKMSVTQFRMYFQESKKQTSVGEFARNLCLLQCSLLRPEYTLKEQEVRKVDIVLDREQRSPAIVCQFSMIDVAELAKRRQR